MSTEHIIRAWRDEEYRESLNAEQSAILPESPVGAIDLSESDMAEAEGGDWTRWVSFGFSILPGIINAWPGSPNDYRAR
jgi:mersacidin/lichenicidin family type 2 lantibiotic